MWQRFTERARRVVYFGQEEALLVGAAETDVEHLLLGLIREDDNVAMRILCGMGITQEQIREEIELWMKRGTAIEQEGVQLTPRSKRVIDYAYEEARRLDNNYIGTEHLLLGVIRETGNASDWWKRLSAEGCGADGMLDRLGADLERTRAEVVAFQNADRAEPSAAPAATPVDQGNQCAKRGAERALLGDPASGRAGRLSKAVLQAGSGLWRGRSLISLLDVSSEQIEVLLKHAAIFKALGGEKQEVRFSRPRTLGLLCEEPAMRVGADLETCMAQMSGEWIVLTPAIPQSGKHLSMAEVGRSAANRVDLHAVQASRHETLVELAVGTDVPCINIASDREEPIQALADLLAIQEVIGRLGGHLKLVYFGASNGLLHSLLLACAKVGVNLTAVCPPGHEPAPEYVAEAQRIGAGWTGSGTRIEILGGLEVALIDADVLYIDLQANWGAEGRNSERRKVLASCPVGAEWLAGVRSDVLVLTRLPDDCEPDVAAELRETYYAVRSDQRDNRLHILKALIALMVGL